MNREDELNTEYRKTIQRLEEQEDALSGYQRKGQHLAETTYTELRQMTQVFEDKEINYEALRSAEKELNHLEEEFRIALNHEKKKIQLQQKDVEQAYRMDLKKLDNA